MPKPSRNKARIEYHLRELEIAVSPGDPRRMVPIIPASCRSVLDVGCGIGQTLIGLGLPESCCAYGVEPDIEAVKVGRNMAKHVRFVAATGEALPFSDRRFDYVFCRLALPYMHVPAGLGEMARVLRPGGTLWLLLHSFPLIVRRFRDHMAARSFTRALFDLYVMANGGLFSLTGRQMFLPLKPVRGEVFQTASFIRRELTALGLIEVQTGFDHDHFITTATKPAHAIDEPLAESA